MISTSGCPEGLVFPKHPVGAWAGEQLRSFLRPLFQEQAALAPGSCPAPSLTAPSYNRGPGFEYLLF